MTNVSLRQADALPSVTEMYQALCRRDGQYEGVFFFAVRTTGVFCRPCCPSRPPRRDNVNFYPSIQDAMSAGYRPCFKCRPLQLLGTPPAGLESLLDDLKSNPDRHWSDEEMGRLGVAPSQMRRWFKQHYGITFHQYVRSLRLSRALDAMRQGAGTHAAACQAGYDSSSAFNQAFRNWSGQSPAQLARGGSPMVADRVLTPLGPMIAVVVDDRLCMLEFIDRRSLSQQFERLLRIHERPLVHARHGLLDQVQAQVTEYFAGRRRVFDVPLSLAGTDFQDAVWQALLTIPFGQTASYEAIARQIDRPGAQRAVGRANGDNRIAIVVPCHRVIRRNGQLSGYGGQVWRKRWLLNHESSW